MVAFQRVRKYSYSSPNEPSRKRPLTGDPPL